MVELIDPKEQLPNDGQYVLAHFPDRPWFDDAPNDEHKWVVVKFVRGITLKEREQLDDLDPRKRQFKVGDEYCNNQVGYRWNAFGSSDFFGQECSVWAELPKCRKIARKPRLEKE